MERGIEKEGHNSNNDGASVNVERGKAVPHGDSQLSLPRHLVRAIAPVRSLGAIQYAVITQHSAAHQIGM